MDFVLSPGGFRRVVFRCLYDNGIRKSGFAFILFYRCGDSLFGCIARIGLVFVCHILEILMVLLRDKGFYRRDSVCAECANVVSRTETVDPAFCNNGYEVAGKVIVFVPVHYVVIFVNIQGVF